MFKVHLLNDGGIAKARRLQKLFEDALEIIESISGTDGREMAIVRTKLQEASFFAKRAMAQRPHNQIDTNP